MSRSSNICSNNFSTNQIGKFSVNDEHTTIFYDPDGKGGIKTKPSRMVYSDGTTDYFNDKGQRVRQVSAKGDEYTFEYSQIFCYMKDKDGKVVGKFNSDGSPLRKRYTIQEADAATQGKGPFTLYIVW